MGLPTRLLLAICILSTSAADDGPTVELPSGTKIHGVYMDVNGQTVSAYLGVPFATAERFAMPTLTETYDRDIEAIQPSKTCFQSKDETYPGFDGAEMWNPPTDLSEDCLSLNIWVPANPDGNVIVWIYGGGFFSGSPSLALYNGSVLAAKTNAVVVNVNYRVGPFGFFYLGANSKAPGNVGLLDQQTALKWIHNNIESFKGDRSKVTLFGESAGGASVTSHLLAPDSHSLFSKIIVNSGSIHNVWATRSPCTMLHISMKTAKALKCVDNYDFQTIREAEGRCTVLGGNVDKIYECMKEKTPDDIQSAGNSDAIYENMLPMEWPFGPITYDDNYFKGDVRRKLFNDEFKKDVSAIFGTVKDEGTFWLPYYLSDSGFSFFPDMGSDSEANAAKIDESNYTASMQAFEGYFGKSSKAIEILKDGFKDLGDEETMYRDGVARFVGDFFFTCNLVEFVDHVAPKIDEAYMYYFKARSSANPWPKWMGVMHGYEIEYEFGYPLINSTAYKQAEKDQTISEKFMQLIKEFVENGKFDAKWPKYNEGGKVMVVEDDTSSKIEDKDIQQKYCKIINDARQAVIDEAKGN
ncbi:hypothetical protein Q1695_008654 [Nippostrongylus brasiliensis]|nr:hypothetical protein Q1695_008654 [Nippostrongylus brasiliensis]